MTGKIDEYPNPASGRVLREDSSVVNLADMALPPSGGDGAKVLSDTNAVPLAADTECKGVYIQNSPGSAGNLRIGLSNTPKLEFYAGSAPIYLAVDNLNKVYVQAVSTATALYTYQV